jgi:hypothetical protein
MVTMHRNGIETYKWSMQIFLVFWLLTNRNKDNVLICERTRIKSREHHSFCFFSLMTKKRIDHRLDMKEQKSVKTTTRDEIEVTLLVTIKPKE